MGLTLLRYCRCGGTARRGTRNSLHRTVSLVYTGRSLKRYKMTGSCSKTTGTDKRKRDDPEVPPADPNKALLKAAIKGDADAIAAALAAGADIATQDGRSKRTALQLAAEKGQVEAIYALVLAGADVAGGEGASQPLTLAAFGGRLKAVQALLSAGATPTAAAMEAAAGLYESSILSTLLAAGGQPSQECLRAAARIGMVDSVQLLLHAGVEVEGSGAVAIAAEYCALDVVGLLLRYGADPNEELDGVPALVHAADNSNADIMRVLLWAGADVEAQPSNATFGRALENCNTEETAEVALAAGAVVQDLDQGYVPLVRLASRADPQVLQALLDLGADVSAAAEVGRTALQAAAVKGWPSSVRLLLKAGASVTVTDDFGSTALHLAAKGDGPCSSVDRAHKVVEVLLAAGAAVAAVDSTGNTPLHFAASALVVETLLAAGAPLEAVNSAGETPMCMALRRRSKECPLALLAAGALLPPNALSLALQRPCELGTWLTACLPASRSITPEQLAGWVEARFSKRPAFGRREPVFGPEEQPAKQRLVWQVWALRSRLPPELLRLIAAMCCILR